MQLYEPACDGPVILFFEVVVCPRRPLRYLCFALIEIIITKDLDPNRIVDLHGHPERCVDVFRTISFRVPYIGVFLSEVAKDPEMDVVRHDEVALGVPPGITHCAIGGIL